MLFIKANKLKKVASCYMFKVTTNNYNKPLYRWSNPNDPSVGNNCINRISSFYSQDCITTIVIAIISQNIDFDFNIQPVIVLETLEEFLKVMNLIEKGVYLDVVFKTMTYASLLKCL